MSILFSRRICSSTTQQPEFPGNNPPCWKPNGCVSGHSSPSLVSGSSQTFWRRRKNSKNITTWADDHGDQGRKPPKWLCNRSIGLLLWADHKSNAVDMGWSLRGACSRMIMQAFALKIVLDQLSPNKPRTTFPLKCSVNFAHTGVPFKTFPRRSGHCWHFHTSKIPLWGFPYFRRRTPLTYFCQPVRGNSKKRSFQKSFADQQKNPGCDKSCWWETLEFNCCSLKSALLWFSRICNTNWNWHKTPHSPLVSHTINDTT